MVSPGVTTASMRERLNPFSVARTRRDWAADLGIFVICLGFLPFAPLGHVIQTSAFWAAIPGWWLASEWVFGVIACLVLWWRRNFPVAVACVLAPLGGLLMAAGAPAVISAYTAASRGRTRVAIAVTVAHVMIALPYLTLIPGAWADKALWMVNVVIIYIATLSIGLAVRSRRQVIDGLRESVARDRREFEERLARVRGDERRQIAREMHDALAHRISLLSVHAGALEYRLSGGSDSAEVALTPQELREPISVIRRTAHHALEDLHQVLDLLKESDVAAELGRGAPQPRARDLSTLITEARTAGQLVRWHRDPDLDALERLRPQAQRTVYRVVQEGLTNARKHTPGAVVDVSIDGAPGGSLVLAIRNALPVGTTASEIPGAGTGLTGLAERVALDGGRLAHHVDGSTFTLTAELPWAHPEVGSDE